jgi:hypothetical protein
MNPETYDSDQGRHYTYKQFNIIWEKVARRFLNENSTKTKIIGSTPDAQNTFINHLRSIEEIGEILGEKKPNNEGQTIYRHVKNLEGWKKNPTSDLYTDKIVLGLKYAKALEAYADGIGTQAQNHQPVTPQDKGFGEVSDLNDITKEEIPQFNNEYNRNGLKAKYINLYGTGNYVFKKENVRCVFDRKEVVLPEDLENIRIGIELTQIELAKKAKKEHWNSDLLGLKSFVRGRTDDEKNLSLNLIFYLSNYYRNLATGGSLSTKVFDDISGNFVTVRQKYLDHAYWEEVVPILAAAFGVALSVITNDNFLLVAKRASTGMGSWRGHYHCAMNEGLNTEDFVDGEPDLFETARRGLKEELGITDNEVLDLRFLTFGYDTINYQWGLHGMVKVNLTAQEVMDNAPSKSVDRWEYEKLFTIKFNVRDVIRFIIDNDPWTPFCKVCIIYTLIQCFGEEAVDREIDWQLKLKTM